MNKRWAASAALAALALGSAGCRVDGACTLIGCVDELNIKVDTADRTWPAGTYAVTVTSDSVVGRPCTFQWAEEPATFTCEGLTIVMRALTTPGQFSQQISITTQGATVVIDEARNGTRLGTGVFTPSYQTFTPNGPECGPVCKKGSEAWTLPP